MSASTKAKLVYRETSTLFILGIFVGGGLCIALTVPILFPMASYLGLLSFFHASEYIITKSFQPNKANFDCTPWSPPFLDVVYLLTIILPLAFLLNHSNEYSASVVASIVEFLLEAWMFPRLKGYLRTFQLVGLSLAVLGQFIRSAAMVEAKDSFTHLIADKKEPGHNLITSGIYSHVRHPAYFGFFLWSLGTQIVLGNPICLAAFYKILYQFFTDRILYSPQRALDSGYIDWGVFRYEERTLVQFFSPDYVQYRAKTWSGFFGIE